MLEQQLNTKLFEHRGRKIILTAAGRRLQKISMRYLEELSTFHTEFIHQNSEVRETLRIGSVSGFGRYVLFPLLCKEDYRYFRLHLTYPTALEIFREIEEGAYDIGFVYHKKISNLLRFQTVYKEELVLLAAKDTAHDLPELDNLNNYGVLPFITYDESDYVFGKWLLTMKVITFLENGLTPFLADNHGLFQVCTILKNWKR
jgi:DNA-binding transcriptional LysR family regulator